MGRRTISGQGKKRPDWRGEWRSILRQVEAPAEQPEGGLAAQAEPEEQAAASGMRQPTPGWRAGRWLALLRRPRERQPETPLPLLLVLKLKKPLGALRIRQQIPRLRLVYQPSVPQPVGDPRSLPVALRLPALHALLSFIFLALLPQHPLSIPTALGLAFAVVVYIQVLAYEEGYGFRQEGD